AGSGSDTLWGMNADSVWEVDGTNRFLNGGRALAFTGVEILSGGNGVDVFQISGSQDVRLRGNGGDDRFAFITGGEIRGDLSGGAGTNTLDYSAYAASGSGYGFAVTVNLAQGTASGVWLGVSGITRVIGSENNDVLTGGALGVEFYGGLGDDVLTGGSGNDLLSGGPGNDQLLGGAGDDQLYGDAGFDFLDGGPGSDHYVVVPNWGVDMIPAGDNSGGDVMDFSLANPSLDFILGDVVTKKGDNIAAYTGKGAMRIIGTSGNDNFIFSPTANAGAFFLDGGSGGTDTLDFSHLLGGVTVDFRTGGASGLAGFQNFESVIGSLGDDVFILGNGRVIIFGGGGHDIASNVLCGYDTVLGVETIICWVPPVYTPSDPAPAPQTPAPQFILVTNGNWLPIPTRSPIALIDVISWKDMVGSMSEKLVGQVEYLWHLKAGPKYKPEAGNLVELPGNVATSASLRHVDPAEINTQLATLTERLVLGNDSWSQALALNNVISSNPNVQVQSGGADLWNLSQAGTPIQIGSFVPLQRFGGDKEGLSSGQSGASPQAGAILSAMEVQAAYQGAHLAALNKPMTISFALTREILDRYDALGILYFDEATGNYVLVNAQVLYWDPSANGGLGDWVSKPPSPDAVGRIVTEQTVTGTYVLVGLSQ
ncbi:MAG: calcium-binding protein, partial [Anaerolineaceae bacterium]|nr:calcium-binding protein [Anaerolineaceae bacterium]